MGEIGEFLEKIIGGKERPPKYPKVVLNGAYTYHSDQIINGDSHSVGGDYWLTGEDLLNTSDSSWKITNEQFLRGGNGVVVMDTATRQTRGKTPAETTRPFAWNFLHNYYFLIKNGYSPKEAMKGAYNNAYYAYRGLGSRTEATFTFVTVVDGIAYCLWIGNTEAVIKRNDKWEKLPWKVIGKLIKRKNDQRQILASKKGMVFPAREGVQPTVLVASGIKNVRFSSAKVGKRDKIYVFTDGVFLILKNKNLCCLEKMMGF